MKVLLLHNFYQSSYPSGEDIVYKAEKELLKLWGQKTGNIQKVICYEKYNDEINNFSFHKKILLPFTTSWSRKTYRELRNILKKEKPTIVHFHNIFYLISPSAYYACKDAGIPIIQTLHNFRFFCVNGLLMRHGGICEQCVGKFPWKGIVYGCHRNSRLYSIPAALSGCLHRFLETWEKKVDAYIALTEFGKGKFAECGLPEEKIFVKPNFLSNPSEPNYSNGGYVVFIGRLSSEKGLNTLISTFKILKYITYDHFSLKIIGDGPQRKHLENMVRAKNIHNIEFIGRRSFDECMEFLKNSMFMVMPSICYEGFPLVIGEAFACGKPVIASKLGALTELIEDGKTGLLFEPRNPKDLASKIKMMLENKGNCIEMGKKARKEFEKKYTAEKNFKMLLNIYNKIIHKTHE